MRRIVSLGLILVLAMSVHATKVVFRLDDPRVTYDSAHARILQLFIEKDVPLSVAVVPCDSAENPYEPNDLNYLALLQSPNIEICLHGLTHRSNNRVGEFGILDASETERRIQKGEAVLEHLFDREIVTFIPPGNVLNASLPTVLARNGFCVLSGDMFKGIVDAPSVNYYPETLGHLMEQKGIWNAARESIFGCNEQNAVCVVMFHDYDLQGEKSWNDLEQLLDDCKANERVELYTFASLVNSGDESAYKRIKANRMNSGLKKVCLSKGVLHAEWKCYVVHMLNAVMYALIAILGIIICLMKSNYPRRKALLCIAIGVFAIAFCAAWWHWLSPMKLLLAVFMLMLGEIVFAMCYYTAHRNLPNGVNMRKNNTKS